MFQLQTAYFLEEKPKSVRKRQKKSEKKKKDDTKLNTYCTIRVSQDHVPFITQSLDLVVFVLFFFFVLLIFLVMLCVSQCTLCESCS